jgi:hypothetical protein
MHKLIGELIAKLELLFMTLMRKSEGRSMIGEKV